MYDASFFDDLQLFSLFLSIKKNAFFALYKLCQENQMMDDSRALVFITGLLFCLSLLSFLFSVEVTNLRVDLASFRSFEPC